MLRLTVNGNPYLQYSQTTVPGSTPTSVQWLGLPCAYLDCKNPFLSSPFRISPFLVAQSKPYLFSSQYPLLYFLSMSILKAFKFFRHFDCVYFMFTIQYCLPLHICTAIHPVRCHCHCTVLQKYV